jgi:hypothetical protein
MSTKQSAIEEAGRTLRGWVDGVYLSCPDERTMTAEDDAAYKVETDNLARRVVIAWVSAIAEDEASVEAVAGTVADGFYFGMPQVDPDAVPNGLARDVARAVLRTLLERAKSPDALGDGP